MSNISIIVAMAENNVIGAGNDIPWYIPEDLKHFKTITMGKPCIMGRKTFESIVARLGKPLPGRTSIVISKSGYTHEGAKTASTIETTIEIAKEESAEEIMIIGGAQIYEQTLPIADRLYLTKVHETYDGDAFFPEINNSDWKTLSEENHNTHTFLTLERK